MFRFVARNFSEHHAHRQNTGVSMPSPWPSARSLLIALAFSVAITSTGCDSSSTFLPPPPDGLRSAAADGSAPRISSPVPPGLDTSLGGVSSVEVILGHREPSEITAITAAARMQAGVDKTKLRTTVLGDKDPPAREVDLVREALTRNPLALIVEPADPTDARMAEVLQKAREDGIPVVLLNRPLSTSTHSAGANGAGKSSSVSAASPPSASATPAGLKPLVLVTAPSFTASAQKLVASALRNAKNAKLDPKGYAVLMINSVGDPFIPERTLAIRNALKEKGITSIEEITFSKTADAGAKLLTEKLKSNPKLVLVFAIDGLSTFASQQVMNDLIPDRLFIQSAYAAEGSLDDMTRVGDFAAVAGFLPARLVRKAISTAVNLVQGQSVPSRVELSVELYDSPENSTTPQSPVYYKSKPAAKKSP